MRVVQISDLHIPDFEAIQLRDFMNKRLTGGLNLLTKRRGAHPPEVAERLVEDITYQNVDHVVVTGDITNLSLPGEFQRAARLLRNLGGYERLTVVPGNHDVYTQGAADQKRFESYFGHLLFKTEENWEDWTFPAVKRVGDLLIIALSSAIPTPPFMAYGRVGEEQLNRLPELLKEHPGDLFRIALVHHNLHRRRSRMSEATAALQDRDSVVARLSMLNMDLVLHGHTHVAHRFSITRGERSMLVVGCGSSTWDSTNPAHVARYNVYDIENGELAKIRTRVYDRSRRRFEWMM
jgi:3',5'-cyclic AMP phosphodiesterase CpdA